MIFRCSSGSPIHKVLLAEGPWSWITPGCCRKNTHKLTCHIFALQEDDAKAEEAKKAADSKEDDDDDDEAE